MTRPVPTVIVPSGRGLARTAAGRLADSGGRRAAMACSWRSGPVRSIGALPKSIGITGGVVSARPALAHGTMGPVYDAVVVVSFGGPEGPDDVMPFLERVTQGRDVPPERLRKVAQQYDVVEWREPDQRAQSCARRRSGRRAHGGRSLAARLLGQPQLASAAPRHRAPDARRRRRARARLRHVRIQLVLVVPAVPRRHRARAHRGRSRRSRDREAATVLRPSRLRRAVRPKPRGCAGIAARQRARAARQSRSPPTASRSRWQTLPTTSRSSGRRRDSSPSVRAKRHAWELVFQSRSGPPTQPWLEPDVGDHIDRLATDGVLGVVVVPIGFVSDHMEIVYDLDVVAAERAERAGIAFARAATPGTAPEFVAMVRELVEERLDPSLSRRSLGRLGDSARRVSGLLRYRAVTPTSRSASSPRPSRSSSRSIADGRRVVEAPSALDRGEHLWFARDQTTRSARPACGTRRGTMRR